MLMVFIYEKCVQAVFSFSLLLKNIILLADQVKFFHVLARRTNIQIGLTLLS